MIRRDNFTIPQGTDWSVRWDLTDADGNSLDLSGWTVRSQVRKRHSSPNVLHEWSIPAGNVELDESSLTLHVPNHVSTAWTWDKGVYDIEITAPDGTVVRITQGNITVSPEVTR